MPPPESVRTPSTPPYSRCRPRPGRTPAVEPDGRIRGGAWVAEIDAASDCLKGWPQGMRRIVRKERPHPGAQLRFTDADGLRLTCFATNTTGTPIAALELRHRHRQPGPRRGPRPKRPGHRPTQPPPARHRAELRLSVRRSHRFRHRPPGQGAGGRGDRLGAASSSASWRCASRRWTGSSCRWRLDPLALVSSAVSSGTTGPSVPDRSRRDLAKSCRRCAHSSRLYAPEHCPLRAVVDPTIGLLRCRATR